MPITGAVAAHAQRAHAGGGADADGGIAPPPQSSPAAPHPAPSIGDGSARYVRVGRHGHSDIEALQQQVQNEQDRARHDVNRSASHALGLPEHQGEASYQPHHEHHASRSGHVHRHVADQMHEAERRLMVDAATNVTQSAAVGATSPESEFPLPIGTMLQRASLLGSSSTPPSADASHQGQAVLQLLSPATAQQEARLSTSPHNDAPADRLPIASGTSRAGAGQPGRVAVVNEATGTISTAVTGVGRASSQPLTVTEALAREAATKMLHPQHHHHLQYGQEGAAGAGTTSAAVTGIPAALLAASAATAIPSTAGITGSNNISITGIDVVPSLSQWQAAGMVVSPVRMPGDSMSTAALPTGFASGAGADARLAGPSAAHVAQMHGRPAAGGQGTNGGAVVSMFSGPDAAAHAGHSHSGRLAFELVDGVHAASPGEQTTASAALTAAASSSLSTSTSAGAIDPWSPCPDETLALQQHHQQQGRSPLASHTATGGLNILSPERGVPKQHHQHQHHHVHLPPGSGQTSAGTAASASTLDVRGVEGGPAPSTSSTTASGVGDPFFPALHYSTPRMSPITTGTARPGAAASAAAAAGQTAEAAPTQPSHHEHQHTHCSDIRAALSRGDDERVVHLLQLLDYDVSQSDVDHAVRCGASEGIVRLLREHCTKADAATAAAVDTGKAEK